MISGLGRNYYFRNGASNAHAYAGRGIGLSLSLRILRKYGASVQITSRLGEGTTVAIDFDGDR